MKSYMHPSTEYLAVARNRLYALTVMLFLLGCIVGLMIGYVLWYPPEIAEPKPRPTHEKIKEAK